MGYFRKSCKYKLYFYFIFASDLYTAITLYMRVYRVINHTPNCLRLCFSHLEFCICLLAHLIVLDILVKECDISNKVLNMIWGSLEYILVV